MRVSLKNRERWEKSDCLRRSEAFWFTLPNTRSGTWDKLSPQRKSSWRLASDHRRPQLDLAIHNSEELLWIVGESGEDCFQVLFMHVL